MNYVNNVPLKGSAPAGSPGAYTSKEQIVALLKGTDPAAVSRTGQSYVNFASAYEQMVANLKGFSNELAEAWTGPASNAAQSQLLDMHEAAMEIFRQSDSTGRVVQAHGDTYLSWYRSSMPTPKTTQEAQQWMQAANGRITQTWQAMPDNLSTGLRPVGGQDKWTSPEVNTSGLRGGGGSGAAHGGGNSANQPGVYSPGGNHSNSPTGNDPQHGPGHFSPSPGPHGQPQQWWPGGSNGSHRTDLSQFDPAGPGMSGPGSGSGPIGTGGPGISGPGISPFGGGVPGPGGVPGVPGLGVVPGSGGSSGVGNGLGRGALGSEISRVGAAGRTGSPGVVGMPGRECDEEEQRERERSAWMTEERSLWDGDVEFAPSVIGDAPPRVSTPEIPAEQEIGEQDAVALMQGDFTSLLEPHVSDPEQPSAPESQDAP